MVSTRIVIALGAVVLFAGFGAGWISSTSGAAPLFSPVGIHTYLDLLQWIGSAYGPCNCPPVAGYGDGTFLLLLLPYLVAPGPLAASLILFPAGFVLSAISFFRWKLMWVAGAISVLACLLWFAGYNAIQGHLSQQFPNVSVGLGPYQAGLGGAVLVIGYVLSRLDKLDWPIE